MFEIRKSKRAVSLMKKRFEGMKALQDFPPSSTAPHASKKLEISPDLVAGVWSNDYMLQFKSITQFRKLLSIERNPPIEEVIDSGVVPRFVYFLKKDHHPLRQFEAAWALANIASGPSDHSKVLIDHNAVPVFFQLLDSSNDDVRDIASTRSDIREKAVWALGNVAGESPQSRDFVLSFGALDLLLSHLDKRPKLSMLRNATWTLSNLCRVKPLPPFDQVKDALPTLKRLIYSKDEEVLTDVCLALSCLSDGTNDKIGNVITYEFFPRLVELLLHPYLSIVFPALCTVGNIVTAGDDDQTKRVISCGALPSLANLLTLNYNKSIKKEACRTISKINKVIEANLFTPLVNLLQNAEFGIKKEAAWAITNAIYDTWLV